MPESQSEEESVVSVEKLAHSLPHKSVESANPQPLVLTNRSMEDITCRACVRPPLDVIATFVNTSDHRAIKADLLRAQARLNEESRTQGTIRSKESSGEWGWFEDIDSSSESWSGGDSSLVALRKKYERSEDSMQLEHEASNQRVTAAHKTFPYPNCKSSRVLAAAIAIPKFRIVQSRTGGDRHAEYLVTLKLGRDFYAEWKRYSEFASLVKTLEPDSHKRTEFAWKCIDTRWFNRLEPSYLHKKCISLENFIRELMYELMLPSMLLEFLGGSSGKVNARPVDPTSERPPAQVPKDLRPAQPPQERELFEKLWKENFKRSSVQYSGDTIA